MYAIFLQTSTLVCPLVHVGWPGLHHVHERMYGLCEDFDEGDRVEFEIEEPQRGRKGRQAINVSVLESSASFRGQGIWPPNPGDRHCTDCGFTNLERNGKCAKCHRIHSRRRSRSRSRKKCRRRCVSGVAIGKQNRSNSLNANTLFRKSNNELVIL